MNKILELREKRAKAWETAKAFLDTKRGADGIVSAEDTAVYDKMEADVVALKIFQHAQQRQIGLGRGFVQPLHAMRPGAVVDDVRKMRVQGKGEEPCGTGRLVGRSLRQGGIPHV